LGRREFRRKKGFGMQTVTYPGDILQSGFRDDRSGNGVRCGIRIPHDGCPAAHRAGRCGHRKTHPGGPAFCAPAVPATGGGGGRPPAQCGSARIDVAVDIHRGSCTLGGFLRNTGVRAAPAGRDRRGIEIDARPITANRVGTARSPLGSPNTRLAPTHTRGSTDPRPVQARARPRCHPTRPGHGEAGGGKPAGRRIARRRQGRCRWHARDSPAWS